MHVTQPIFRSWHSLYLLVLDASRGEPDGEVEDWLRLIGSYHPGSKTLVVINHCNQYPLEIEEQLREKFPFVRKILRTDCAAPHGLEELKDEIEEWLQYSADLHAPLPAAWLEFKHAFAELPYGHASDHEYLRLCEAHDIATPEDQQRLLDVLRNLGAVVHFRDVPTLHDLGVFKAGWVVQGISSIMHASALAETGGVLRGLQLGGILDSAQYPPDLHGTILRLMQHFDLCFPLSEPDGDCFLVPELLPKNPPEPVYWSCLSTQIAFQYHYRVLPESLFARFIVRTHELSRGRSRWRYGVCLRRDRDEALVRADLHDRVISIVVGGDVLPARALFATIRAAFDSIDRETPGLEVAEKVLVTREGKPLAAPDYHDLLLMAAEGETHLTFADNRIVRLPLCDFLDRIEEPVSRTARLVNHLGHEVWERSPATRQLKHCHDLIATCRERDLAGQLTLLVNKVDGAEAQLSARQRTILLSRLQTLCQAAGAPVPDLHLLQVTVRKIARLVETNPSLLAAAQATLTILRVLVKIARYRDRRL